MKKVLFLFLLLSLALPVFVLAEQIDINSATLSQLDELTGIGPTYAQRIIDGRPYSSVDDLDRVKGIGPKTLQKIKDQGLAYVGNPNDQNPNQTPNPNDQNPNITPTPAPTPEPAPTPAITYLSGIFLNEILPNPAGADETNEWIELYNSNNSDVDLSSWQIQDTKGTITTYTIPKDTKILANGYLVFKRPDTKIMLNNDEDGLNLLTPDGKIINSVSFIKAPLGQSYNKVGANWQWSLTLTPGNKNIISSATKSSTALPKTKNSDNNNGIEAGLADLSQTTNINQDNNKTTNPWFLFFTALAITIILATIVLFIKFKLKGSGEANT